MSSVFGTAYEGKADEGLQTAAVKLDTLGQFHCGLYIDQYDIDL